MGLDIILVKDVTVPYWEQEHTLCLGEVDGEGRESLFSIEFGIKSILEYSASETGTRSYNEYLQESISSLRRVFPMIVRLWDYYEDAVYPKEDICPLRDEILSLLTVIKYERSKRFLEQLLDATAQARDHDAGLIFIAD
ncbi:MAG: hypothetical protein UZ17_ACD001000004 [Acidobacteria bacterium OLB17]|nr:MAG: hypothetical protein UZ17_ACD001000004 [Acidobacteria bacterium OLB17]MCZ2390087.1 hypothetical protein [Acidobacteriota bacterium]